MSLLHGQISLGAPLLIGWAWCAMMRCAYFRVFGYGLCFEWGGGLTFSERMRITNYRRFGKLVIRTLKPERC